MSETAETAQDSRYSEAGHLLHHGILRCAACGCLLLPGDEGLHGAHHAETSPAG